MGHRGSHVRRLSQFVGVGYDKGRGKAICALWALVVEPLQRSVWCPPATRSWILRVFGAKVGHGTYIRHGVRVHWPWKLRVGDHSWIGVGAWLLNLEQISIGDDVCISQGAILCTGSHKAYDPAFEFDNGPIVVEDGAWIALRAVVLRGVIIGQDAVVGANAVVSADIPAGARVSPPTAVVRTQG